jgi:hypothetical protein
MVSKFFNKLSLTKFVYPASMNKPEEPPTMMFVPEDLMFEKMIEGACRYNEQTQQDNLLSKFSEREVFSFSDKTK